MAIAKLTPTPGEVLTIWRLRQNLTQAEAAKRLDVSEDKYRDWELDRGDDIPPQDIGELDKLEVYRLLRRRKGWTQAELSRKMRCSRVWVHKMERGTANCERLRQYWGV